MSSNLNNTDLDIYLKPNVDKFIPSILKTKVKIYNNDYFATLSYNNILKNNNKFFKMQLLESDTMFFIYYRYGRIGTTGEIDINPYKNIDDAIEIFENTFYEKCKIKWDKRNISNDIEDINNIDNNIYSYTETKNNTNENNDIDKLTIEENKKINEILNDEIVYFIKYIYNKKNYEKLKDLGFDVKIPLGSLSENQINKAFKILNKISDMLKELDTDKDKKLDDNIINSLTSKFYSIIPTYITKTTIPPPINNIDILNNKIDLLNSLLSSSIMYKNLLQNSNNDIYNLYNSLNTDIKSINNQSDEYILIDTYLNCNIGGSHGIKGFDLINLYRINQKNINDNFKHIPDKTYLLWHGTGTINVVGILTQGLLINPDNVIHHGKMFGNGIYFANCSSKSCNYSTYDNNNYGILLLCEVVLEDMVKYLSSYHPKKEDNIKSLRGIGKYIPNKKLHQVFEDTIVPIGNLIENPTTYKHGSPKLYYDEFIVYNEKSVRIKYVLIVKKK